MSSDSASINLTHHFLIAMPGLQDESFSRSVVYLCEHNAKGALGLVINKPTPLRMQALFDKVEMHLGREDLSDQWVFSGGPLQPERGFVLHDPIRTEPVNGERLSGTAEALADKESALDDSAYASTLQIPGGLDMTTSRDVLEALSTGAGPRRVFITLGYASWGEGQLEAELAENAWLTVEADPEIIFDTPAEQRYDRALSLLGVASWRLSSQSGRA